MSRRALEIAVCGSLLAGCGDKEGGLDCTDIGCTDGLEIQLQPELHTQGAYVATLLADGATITCSASLPLPEDGGSSCDVDGAYLGTSGSALSESEHRLTGFYLPSGPAEVSISVTRDDVEILSEEVEPVYEELMPNGEECGPVCVWAMETVSVSSP